MYKPNYKALLIEARKIREKSGAAAFKRATILCQVFDDRDFRTDNGNLDDFAAAAILDDYCQDLAFGFLELRAMLQFYPRTDQWADGLLRKMHGDMLAAVSTPDEAEAKPARRRATLAELERAETEAKDAAAKARNYETQLEAANVRIAELMAEVARLRAELRAAREQQHELAEA